MVAYFVFYDPKDKFSGFLPRFPLLIVFSFFVDDLLAPLLFRFVVGNNNNNSVDVLLRSD